jgi:hypothetical protein
MSRLAGQRPRARGGTQAGRHSAGRAHMSTRGPVNVRAAVEFPRLQLRHYLNVCRPPVQGPIPLAGRGQAEAWLPRAPSSACDAISMPR